ncbi:MAG: hypothetical protein V4760_08575, partial [Bdellovibrionota bacterium]
IGAAWATLLASLIYGSLSHWQGQKSFHIRWETRRIAVIYSVLFAGVALHLLTMSSLAWSYGPRVPLRLAIVAGYVWLGFRFGYLQPLVRRLVPTATH